MVWVSSFIGLGSNLNEPVAQLQRACQLLTKLPDSRLRACSSLYRSHPMTLPDSPEQQQQPDYINAVVELETALAPLSLLDALQTIELKQGRDRRGGRWCARTLDLDILLYGNIILDTPRLKLPHPGLAVREFVLYPLGEIAPDLVLPTGIAIDELTRQCPRRGMQRLKMSVINQSN